MKRYLLPLLISVAILCVIVTYFVFALQRNNQQATEDQIKVYRSLRRTVNAPLWKDDMKAMKTSPEWAKMTDREKADLQGVHERRLAEIRDFENKYPWLKDEIMP